MLINSQLNFISHLARYSLIPIVVSILTISTLVSCPPAFALLRQHHETPNVLRYHAQDSLKDRDGNTWQVLLFPDKSRGAATKYFLRLVGFPGVNSFQHPQSLEVLTSEGKIITATDAYQLFPAVDNVGQYDLTSIIERIPAGTVKLSTPLQNNRELALKIPAEVTSEWQLLVRELEPDT